MAKRDLLFELLRPAEKTLSRPPDATEDTSPPPEPTSDKPSPAPAASGETGIPVNGSTITIAAVAVLVVFFCGYVLGRHAARPTSDAAFDELTNAPAQPAALDVRKTPPAPKPSEATPAPAEPAGPRPTPAAPGPKKITRERGLNYLIIESFQKKEAAERARAFLEHNAVTATIEQTGRRFELVGIVGYEGSERTKRARQAFKAQIESLGQQYKNRPGAQGADFRTCYYKKW